mgnify:CR=1 FL=1
MPTRILRNDRPKGGLTQAGKRHDLKAVRWYVLTLPTAAGGRRDRISPSKGLDVELSRRERRGEALFEYFAPSYVEVRKDGKHEAAPAVQLRVYPFFGRGNLPHEAGTPLV